MANTTSSKTTRNTKHTTTEAEFISQSYKYLGGSRVAVALKTATGEMMSFVITTKAMIESVDKAVELFNRHPRAMLHELDIF
jgi:hypothetical protein